MTINAIALEMMENPLTEHAFQLGFPDQWDEDDSFREAEQPEAIGKVLIGKVHRSLTIARIGYLFRETMSEKGRVKLAKASKVSAKLQFFANLDFLIEVNWEAWKELTHEQRVALIDHELCHCTIEDTDKGTNFVIRHHDIEEFGEIVQRWGLWMPDVREFGRVLKQQGDLFAEQDISKVTFSAPGIEPVEMTGEQLSRAVDLLEGTKDR